MINYDLLKIFFIILSLTLFNFKYNGNPLHKIEIIFNVSTSYVIDEISFIITNLLIKLLDIILICNSLNFSILIIIYYINFNINKFFFIFNNI